MMNREIADIFGRIADILEINGENPFRIRAYRHAALNIEGLARPVEDYAADNTLENIEGIGKDLAGKIREYAATGRISFYEDLKKTIPRSAMEMLDIPGVGPRMVNLFHKQLGIKSLGLLERAIKDGKLDNIKGIGERTRANILRGIEYLSKSGGRVLLPAAEAACRPILKELKNLRCVKAIEVAGSVRRRKETIGDIDMVAASDNPRAVMDAFTTSGNVREVIAKGMTKSAIRTGGGIQVDLRVVKRDSYGSALVYLTGSKMHNIKLRETAIKKRMKINEYGVFAGSAGKKIAGRDEKGVYRALGMSFVPPEMREDRGEIEAALKHKIPDLVTEKDIRADLHIHSSSSDGSMSIDEIARACAARGYSYAVLTDHSGSLKIARGLEAKELFANLRKIDKINAKMKKFRLLKGAEVDILSDGRLDYDDSVLRSLDFVIAAIHTGFKQPKETLTGRILKAMDNKHVNMIAHLTGRLMGMRQGYEVDFDVILNAARDTNTALEINAFPERLDIDDAKCRLARDAGIMVGISSDSHAEHDMDNMFYGVGVARRGWLESCHVLNTLSVTDFLKKIRK
ncbi:MAG: DNA polymerase/3'-5' exonuclease PolX [Candidatus Omnitrophota bacterium]